MNSSTIGAAPARLIASEWGSHLLHLLRLDEKDIHRTVDETARAVLTGGAPVVVRLDVDTDEFGLSEAMQPARHSGSFTVGYPVSGLFALEITVAVSLCDLEYAEEHLDEFRAALEEQKSFGALKNFGVALEVLDA